MMKREKPVKIKVSDRVFGTKKATKDRAFGEKRIYKVELL
jgi:hypothetical protein